MDELRRIVTPESAYSEQEREIVYRTVICAAKTISELGHNVIIDATGNMRRWRELARHFIPRFAEIYLKCSIENLTPDVNSGHEVFSCRYLPFIELPLVLNGG